MSTQVNTFTSLDDGYTAAEWEAEYAESDAAHIAAIEHPLCFTPRSLRPRRARAQSAVGGVSGRLPWHEPVTETTADQFIGGGTPSGWNPGAGIPAREVPADRLPDPDVILTPPADQSVHRGEARVHEHGRRPCHKVADHRPSGETRWRTPQSLGLPWRGSEFVLVGPDDELIPGTHVTVTHKNGSTSQAYVASLGPRTTCGGRVGYTR